jgi:transporter family protein
MTWLAWALLSAVFAALTAILAKLGVAGIDADLATAVRTSVVVVFAWLSHGYSPRWSFRSLHRQDVAVSDAVAPGHGPFLDLLFSRA